jgi:hypothetical protein
MFEKNEMFEEFREMLLERGVTMRCLWEASAGVKRGTVGHERARKGTHDVALYAFVGDGFSPAIGTAVLVDYGPRDGFGIWLETGTTQIDADVDQIVGTKKGGVMDLYDDAMPREVVAAMVASS